MFLSANCGGGEASLELLGSPCLSKIKITMSVKLSALNALPKAKRFAVHHAPFAVSNEELLMPLLFSSF